MIKNAFSDRITEKFFVKYFNKYSALSLVIRCWLVYKSASLFYTNTIVMSCNDISMNGGVCVQGEKTVEQIIGKRIQLLRKKKGYTQQQFAEIIGLSTNYLSDIERGRSSARLDKLVAIINALECSADDVFADVIDLGYKIKNSRLSERLEALAPKERETAYAILDAFISKAEQ